jgi:hypothetical protein
MERYRNLGGGSGVVAFEIAPRAITVQFADGGKYVYDHASPGKGHVAEMKRLAKAGRGLATYINRHVRENYARKL